MSITWKWIRVHDDIYDELKELGQFGDSFNDIISHLLRNQAGRGGPAGLPTMLGRDEVKARLKKFDSHTKAISRLVRENISYTNNE